MAHYENKTYQQLCTSLIKMEEEDAATAALDGLKSERGIRKVKAADESNAETAMAAVEDNTERNRSNLSVRFNPRGHNAKYNSRSRSNSNDRGKQRRSPSPAFQSRQRRREQSRSPSPYGRQERSQERSPGRDRRIVRYAEVNQQWRTGGSGYRDSRTEGRYNESSALTVGSWDTSRMLAREIKLLLFLLVLVLVESSVTLVGVMVTKHTNALIGGTADPFRTKT